MKRHNKTVKETTKRILDIGCGAYPRGDVNIDLFPKIPQPKNFVLADAHHLPFANHSFTGVVCSHTLEHLQNPLQALKEMNRVSKYFVRIFVPSQFSIANPQEHIFTWNKITLKNLLSLVFKDVYVQYQSFNLLGGTLARYIPLLNVLLSKMGYHPRLYALCKRGGD